MSWIYVSGLILVGIASFLAGTTGQWRAIVAVLLAIVGQGIIGLRWLL